MRVRTFLLQAAALILLFAFSGIAEEALPVLEYYYENYCESCHPDQDFAEEFSALTADSLENWKYQAYNVVRSDGQAAYDAMQKRLGLSHRAQSFPVAVLDGHAFIGNSEIYEKLPEYAVSQLSSRDSVLYCLNLDLDADGNVQAMLDALPESICVTLGRYSFESPIQIVDAQSEQAVRNLDVWNTARTSGQTAILAGSNAYIGASEIERLLQFRLTKGVALNGCFFETHDASASPSEPLHAVLILVAALILPGYAGIRFLRAKRKNA